MYRGDVAAFIEAGGLADPAVTVVFADPPYDDDVESMLALVDATSYAHLRFLVVEHRAELPGPGPDHWRIERERRYGATRITCFVPTEGGEP